MAGGGGGSILAMIVALRNNKNLLSKRTSFFNRKRSNIRLKTSAKKRMTSFLDRKPLSEEQIKTIQKQFKARKRVYFALTILTSAICLTLVVFGFHTILESRSTYPAYKEEIQTITYSKLKPQPFRDHMKLGLLKLKDKDYFMAAGRFERALKHKPKNLMAEYYLTKSYCMLCYYRNQACSEARAKVLKNQNQFPLEYKFEYLERAYLK